MDEVVIKTEPEFITGDNVVDYEEITNEGGTVQEGTASIKTETVIQDLPNDEKVITASASSYPIYTSDSDWIVDRKIKIETEFHSKVSAVAEDAIIKTTQETNLKQRKNDDKINNTEDGGEIIASTSAGVVKMEFLPRDRSVPSFGILNQEEHQCDECHELFGNMYDLSVHCETHHQRSVRCTRSEYSAPEDVMDPASESDSPDFTNDRNSALELVASKGKDFSATVTVTSHERILTGGIICNESFDLTKDKHIRTGVKRYICNECCKSFITPSKLAEHQRIHTGVKPYTCNECGNSFTTNSHLKRHERIHAGVGVKPYTCNECGNSFTTNSHLKRHERIHADLGRHTCEQCGKSFTEAYRLIVHQRIHSGELACDEPFATSTDLTEHTRTDVKPYICNEYGKLFATPSQVTEHQRTRVVVKPYTCDECGNSFTTIDNLKRHERIHTGVGRRTCEECGKSFTEAYKLTVHQRIHTGVKPYTCECGKSFISSGQLVSHRHYYAGEHYTCKECGKSFTEASKLTFHQRFHEDVKPYICEECGKSFSRNSHLKIHQHIHTGVKPYSCDECGNSFTQESSLKTHKRIHTGVKPYICDKCGKSFALSKYLWSHKRSHKGGKPYT